MEDHASVPAVDGYDGLTLPPSFYAACRADVEKRRLVREHRRRVRVAREVRELRRLMTPPRVLLCAARPSPLRSARPRGAGRPRRAASRASARGGDSGDSSGPGEPPPPPARASWRAAHERVQFAALPAGRAEL
jgi:hypothetical protein